MNKLNVTFFILLASLLPYKGNSQILTSAPEVTAPVHNGTSYLTNLQIGSIIYDYQTTQFKGKGLDGNWQPMTTPITQWYVDANIAGATASLGTATITTYSEVTNGSLSLTNNTGSDSSVQIACADGTASSGTTCTSSESVGIAFTIPETGAYSACVSFSHGFSLNAAAAGVLSTFQMMETPNSSTSITQTGKTKVSSGNTFSSGSGIQHDITHPVSFCGVFVFSSVGQKTLRVMYKQTVASAPLNSVIDAAGNSDIHWSVYKIR